MAPSCSSLCPTHALQLIPFVTASAVVTCSDESHAAMQCWSYSKPCSADCAVADSAVLMLQQTLTCTKARELDMQSMGEALESWAC